MKIAFAVLGAIALQGCVSFGYHQKRMNEQRDTYYQYADKLSRQVEAGEITPKQMRISLKTRMRNEEEGRAPLP